MTIYDVIIVGTGPAGGQCARELAQNGAKILLIDKSKDFNVNNYSTAGAPMEILSTYDLPQSVVGTEWHKIHIRSTNHKHTWESEKPRGVVLDFMKLRSFLVEAMVKSGSELRMGCQYVSHTNIDGLTEVGFIDSASHQVEKAKCRVLVDATGAERRVLAKDSYDKSKALVAVGMEQLIDVPTDRYDEWSGALNFFIGTEWMPQGYAWIFPMEQNQLKVGIGRYFKNEQIVPHEKSYQDYLQNLIKKTLGSTDLPVLDKHGKTLVYTYGQKDLQYEGNVIAIGDSISSANPFAFEGIRHAMATGRIAAKQIQRLLNGEVHDFRRYPSELRQYFGCKWWTSEKIMNTLYREPDDRKIDLIVQTFKEFSIDEMMELCFHYKFTLATRFFVRYLKHRFFGSEKIK